MKRADSGRKVRPGIEKRRGAFLRDLDTVSEALLGGASLHVFLGISPRTEIRWRGGLEPAPDKATEVHRYALLAREGCDLAELHEGRVVFAGDDDEDGGDDGNTAFPGRAGVPPGPGDSPFLRSKMEKENEPKSDTVSLAQARAIVPEEGPVALPPRSMPSSPYGGGLKATPGAGNSPSGDTVSRPDAGPFPVRHVDGRVEAAPTAARAARLIVTGAARPEGAWTEAQCAAVVAAHEQREARSAEVLARDGNLAPDFAGLRVENLGPMGRLALRRGGY